MRKAGGVERHWRVEEALFIQISPSTNRHRHLHHHHHHHRRRLPNPASQTRHQTPTNPGFSPPPGFPQIGVDCENDPKITAPATAVHLFQSPPLEPHHVAPALSSFRVGPIALSLPPLSYQVETGPKPGPTGEHLLAVKRARDRSRIPETIGSSVRR